MPPRLKHKRQRRKRSRKVKVRGKGKGKARGNRRDRVKAKGKAKVNPKRPPNNHRKGPPAVRRMLAEVLPVAAVLPKTPKYPMAN